MSIAFLFPGQGAQVPNLLGSLPEHPAIAQTLIEAGEILGTDLAALDEAGAMRSTAVVQMSLIIAGTATARALIAEGARPSVVAGMSVGAFGAAVICGALSFADGLRLVRLRGQLMESAFPNGYGLAAIEGLDEAQVEQIVATARAAGQPIYVSNINSPRQIVVAGSDAALEETVRRAQRLGAHRSVRLAVSVPSHCPLLQPVADRLHDEMAGMRFRPPSMTYISNRGARSLHQADAIREDLAASVAHPVRWHDALEVARELGVGLYIEMIPGQVSTDLVRQLFPEVRAISVTEKGLRSAIVLARRG